MKLTLYFDYSVRVLVYLGSHPQEVATISDIASHYKISRNHIMKVVQQLSAQGFVQTARGRKGGIRLAKEPSQISIGQVMRRMEPDFDLLECFESANNNCSLSAACSLKFVLASAMRDFHARLDGYTLEKMLEESSHFQAINSVRFARAVPGTVHMLKPVS